MLILADFSKNTAPVLDYLNVKYTAVTSIENAFKQKADLVIISGIEQVSTLTKEDRDLINKELKKGAAILMLNTGKEAIDIFPNYISNYLNKSLETAHIDIPESGMFDEIKHMDLRYFNNNKAEKPLVYTGLIQVNEDSEVEPLVSGCEHRYARIKDRRKEMITMKGFPILSIENGGKVILSEMMLNKGGADPIAAKLLSNMIIDLTK